MSIFYFQLKLFNKSYVIFYLFAFIRFTLNNNSLILFVLLVLYTKFAFINSEICINILAYIYVKCITYYIIIAIQRT